MNKEEAFAQDYSALLRKHDVGHSVIVTFDDEFGQVSILGTVPDRNFIVHMLQAALGAVEKPNSTAREGTIVTTEKRAYEMPPVKMDS